MIRILLADDHPIVREGLRHMLTDNSSNIVVAGEAEDGPSAVAAVMKEHFDIVILDIKLPGMSGLEALKRIKELAPATNVIMLTMYPEEQYALRAFRAGASGYCNKGDDPQEMLTAIRKVSEGGKYLSRSMAERIVDILDTEVDKPLHDGLSDRELQVMHMIAEGKTVSIIAEELFLSAKTISTYRARILEKMHMKNNAEIMAYALRNGLVE